MKSVMKNEPVAWYFCIVQETVAIRYRCKNRLYVDYRSITDNVVTAALNETGKLIQGLPNRNAVWSKSHESADSYFYELDAHFR